MSDAEYLQGREAGFKFARDYDGDLFELKPIASGTPITDDTLLGKLEGIVTEDVIENRSSQKWAGFRVGVASHLVDNGIIVTTEPQQAEGEGATASE